LTYHKLRNHPVIVNYNEVTEKCTQENRTQFISVDILFHIFPLKTGLPFSSLFSGGDPNAKHCRRRKARTVFSDQQLNGLEKRFEAQRYLSTPERIELANQLNLSETQVKTYRSQSDPVALNILYQYIMQGAL